MILNKHNEPLRILLTEAYTDANVGSGALVENSLVLLRERFPDAQIRILAIYPPAFEDMCPGGVLPDPFSYPYKKSKLKKFLWITYTIWWMVIVWVQARLGIGRFYLFASKVNSYIWADLVISVHAERIKESFYVDALYTLFSFHIAHLLKKKVILFPCTLGPYGFGTKALVDRWLRDVDVLFTRDEASYRIARQAEGIDLGRIVNCPDVAIIQKHIGRSEALELIGCLPEDKLVGISVMKWRYIKGDVTPYSNYKAYVAEMARVADHVIKTYGVKVVLYPTNYAIRGCTTEDREAARDVYKLACCKNNIICVERFLSPSELKGALACSEVNIVTRMHACIFSTGAGVPTVSVNYLYKLREYMDALGLSEYSIDIEEFNAAWMNQAFDKIWIRRGEIRLQIDQRLAEMRARLKTMMDILLEFPPAFPKSINSQNDDSCFDTIDKKRTLPKFTIVTASYRQLNFLKCCAASVQDQTGNFQLEHLIHDGGTGSAFDQWAAEQVGAVCVSEKDDGMYDAINRGFREATGEIVAWLNCDEQYLPGSLERVARYFDTHPEVDIVFGDVILVNEVMIPLGYRRAVMPSIGHIRHSHLSTFSAATFFRRRVLDDGHYLQTRWQTIADAVWIEELLAAGYRAAIIREPLAIFCMLGSNLGQSALLFQERRKWEIELGATDPWRRQWHILEYRFKRLWAGAYWLRKVLVSAYAPGNQNRMSQRRWVSGQWTLARNEAANIRSQREGMMGGLVAQGHRSYLVAIHAACLLAVAVGVDKMTEGDAVKGPLILLFSLMFLSFRAKISHLIPIAGLYFLASWYLLSERPFDTMVVRLGTFTLGAILAIFWAISLRNLAAWVQGTVALIRKIPVPIILTDREGKIILVNHAACGDLQGDEPSFMKKQLYAIALGSESPSTGPLAVSDWDERPPEGVMGLVFDKGSPKILAHASVFVVGKGRYRFYAFMLKDTDETGAAPLETTSKKY